MSLFKKRQEDSQVEFSLAGTHAVPMKCCFPSPKPSNKSNFNKHRVVSHALPEVSLTACAGFARLTMLLDGLLGSASLVSSPMSLFRPD